jgi:hypothetical protein
MDGVHGTMQQLMSRCEYALSVRSTARYAIHLQFDISATALEIRAVRSPKCIVWCAVDCTKCTENRNEHTPNLKLDLPNSF